MKKLLSILVFFGYSYISFSQIYDPVKWSFDVKKNQPNEYELLFTANIQEHWHIYTQYLNGESGPIPTQFRFNPLKNAQLIGKTSEPKGITEHDPNFDMILTYFENQVVFKQKVTIKNTTVVSGELEYMACDAERCLPPEIVPFEFTLTFEATENTPNVSDTATAVLVTDTTTTLDTTSMEIPQKTNFLYKHPIIDIENPVQTCSVQADDVQSKSDWTIFFLGFIGGLLALLTPCVFPMVPLTVSFFTKSSKGKKGLWNAFLYGFFILMVYIILSIPFHLLDSIDPNILNTISTNTYLNVFFFIIFVVFAISFFGYFEITLPSSIANKADNASNVGGVIGIFFMSLTLALVSFSCTGPILGSLLAGSLSSNGGAMQLTFGMSGFGLALALPFALFAAFPGWLQSLPKSGGWLNTVKVLLGFIELALAVKFLSNADLVEHWNLVTYELFLGIWILIGVSVVLYLVGVIRFPHHEKIKKINLSRILLIGIFAAFTVYLTTGFKFSKETKTFSGLSLLSGLAPPAGYSWIYPNHCPLNLNCFHDYQEGLEYAKKTNKPIMLDFTGWACVNCRKMEEQVWSVPDVFKLINQEFVLISLYVDDRQLLADSLQHEYMTTQGKKKKIKTVGDRWATFQTETFVNNSQPWYALISNTEKLLTNPVGYTPNPKEFEAFLRCGIDAHKQEFMNN